MHCLVGDVALSIQTGELDGAQEYLNRLGRLIEEVGRCRRTVHRLACAC